MENTLTVAGFVALIGLLLTVAGVVISISKSNASLSERVARLEERIRIMRGNGNGNEGR